MVKDHRIPLRNSSEILPIKWEPNDEDNSMLPSFYHAPRKSSQLNTANNQRLILLTNNMKNPLNRGKHA